MPRLPPVKTRTKKQLTLAHALTHGWFKNPMRIGFRKSEFSSARKKIRALHNKLVVMMRKRGLKHNSPL